MRQRANVRLGHECPRLLNSRCPGIESRRYARRVPLSRGNCARRRTAALHFARRIAPAANKSRCVVNSASRLGALGAARQAECTSRSLGCERVMWLLTQQSSDNRRPATHGGTALARFSWRYQSRAQSSRKLLLDLLCPGCPIANLVITTIGICFATGQARQVSAIAPHPHFCRGRCVLLLQFFAFRTTTRHAPSRSTRKCFCSRFCSCPNFDALRLILRHSPTTFSRVIAFWARRRCSRAVHERADRRVPSKCVGRQTP